MRDMTTIANLLNVGFIRFADVQEGETFLEWMNSLVDDKGESWIMENRNLIISQFQQYQRVREEAIEVERKRQKRRRGKPA